MLYKNSIGKQGFYLILEGQCRVKIYDHQKHVIEVKYNMLLILKLPNILTQ